MTAVIIMSHPLRLCIATYLWCAASSAVTAAISVLCNTPGDIIVCSVSAASVILFLFNLNATQVRYTSFSFCLVITAATAFSLAGLCSALYVQLELIGFVVISAVATIVVAGMQLVAISAKASNYSNTASNASLEHLRPGWSIPASTVHSVSTLLGIATGLTAVACEYSDPLHSQPRILPIVNYFPVVSVTSACCWVASCFVLLYPKCLWGHSPKPHRKQNSHNDLYTAGWNTISICSVVDSEEEVSLVLLFFCYVSALWLLVVTVHAIVVESSARCVLVALSGLSIYSASICSISSALSIYASSLGISLGYFKDAVTHALLTMATCVVFVSISSTNATPGICVAWALIGSSIGITLIPRLFHVNSTRFINHKVTSIII